MDFTLDQSEVPGELYRSLMRDARFRVGIAFLALEQLEAGAPRIAGETACLQLRMICEIMALMALIANNNMLIDKSLISQSGDQLFTSMAKQHDSYFPIAMAYSHEVAGRFFVVPHDRAERLNGAGLKQIFRRCGKVLHFGSMKCFLSGERDLGHDLPAIRRCLNLIEAWLHGHFGLTKGGKFEWLARYMGPGINDEIKLDWFPAGNDRLRAVVPTDGISVEDTVVALKLLIKKHLP